MAAERRTAILTGAASGIGRAMALGLLESGIGVAAVDRQVDWLRELADTASERRHPGALQIIRADVSEPGAPESIVAQARERFGRIDVLVNNAGIGQGAVKPDQRRNPLRFWEITPEHWQRFVAVNATAPLMMARAVAGHMREAGSGRIITVTTSLGTMIRAGYVLYGASKAAAEAATAVMAADLQGSGVTANVLVPGGMTDTRILTDEDAPDRSKLIRPEVMVPPLLWLISDAAASVSGRRFLAVHWDRSLPAEQAAEKCDAPIAWTSIATMPIEPD